MKTIADFERFASDYAGDFEKDFDIEGVARDMMERWGDRLFESDPDQEVIDSLEEIFEGNAR